MRLAPFVIVLAVSALATAALAQTKAKRAAHRAKAPQAADRFGAPGFRPEPARMIEIKPGLWISSYGCVTDDGYGRYSPCGRDDNAN